MDNGRKNRGRQDAGKGFCLLPWGQIVRNGGMADWPDAAIAVLPVLALHRNRDGLAWPRYELICALAQVGKNTVAEAIAWLVENGWIEKTSRHGMNTYNEYKLLFGYEPADRNSRDWIAIYRQFIEWGAWGTMRPSERRVYLTFRACAWVGLDAIEHGHVNASYHDLKNYDADKVPPIVVRSGAEELELTFEEFAYLPEHRHDPAKVIELSGVNPRTYRAAQAWLMEEGLICLYDDDGVVGPGLIMPFEPGIKFPKVLEAIEKAKEANLSRSKATPGAKRSLAAMRRRAGLGKASESKS